MGTAISPRHVVYGSLPPSSQWPLDLKIDLFLARIDGWHLEVADRCINGLANPEGQQCINFPGHKKIWRAIPGIGWIEGPNTENPDAVQNNIPDAGWAVLQIVLNYFEVVGLFKYFEKSIAKKWRLLFKKGVFDVFPHLEGQNPNVANILWDDLRGGLYHSGIKSGRIYLRHAEPLCAMYFDHENDLLVIDPHAFVVSLRQHLRAYGEKLKDHEERSLRQRFESAYDFYYGH